MTGRASLAAAAAAAAAVVAAVCGFGGAAATAATLVKNKPVACLSLRAFVAEVGAQSGTHLTPEQAASLTPRGRGILAVVGC